MFLDHFLLFGAPLPHAPGARMTVVTLTPSTQNMLKYQAGWPDLAGSGLPPHILGGIFLLWGVFSLIWGVFSLSMFKYDRICQNIIKSTNPPTLPSVDHVKLQHQSSIRNPQSSSL
jgi:hypothetical protein